MRQNKLLLLIFPCCYWVNKHFRELLLRFHQKRKLWYFKETSNTYCFTVHFGTCRCSRFLAKQQHEEMLWGKWRFQILMASLHSRRILGQEFDYCWYFQRILFLNGWKLGVLKIKTWSWIVWIDITLKMLPLWIDPSCKLFKALSALPLPRWSS